MSFVIGKLAWAILKPSNVLALALVLGAILWLFGKRRGARVVAGAAIASVAICTVLPVGAWLLSPLENRFPRPAMPDRVDGIVVLGGAIESRLAADRGTIAVNAKAERLVAFAALARRYPEAKLVFTGGSASLRASPSREGDWVPPFLEAAGISRARVTIERDSRNTEENARKSKALVEPRARETWLIITSARHMPRAVGVFRKLGWSVIGYPVDYMTPREVGFALGLDFVGGLAALDAAAYEWYGLAYYRLSGRTDDWFPRP